jgi:hypothetical protein
MRTKKRINRIEESLQKEKKIKVSQLKKTNDLAKNNAYNINILEDKIDIQIEFIKDIRDALKILQNETEEAEKTISTLKLKMEEALKMFRQHWKALIMANIPIPEEEQEQDDDPK